MRQINKAIGAVPLISGEVGIVSVVDGWSSVMWQINKLLVVVCGLSINQSIKFISNQIKKFDIQCTLYNIHGKLFYNNVATFSISD